MWEIVQDYESSFADEKLRQYEFHLLPKVINKDLKLVKFYFLVWTSVIYKVLYVK